MQFFFVVKFEFKIGGQEKKQILKKCQKMYFLCQKMHFFEIRLQFLV